MDKLKKLSRDLLCHLGIKPGGVEIITDKDGGVVLNLDLPDEEAGILIGYHGETLASLQLVLGMMLCQQAGQWSRLIVNIGDYRQKRTDYLTALAEDTAAKVAATGEPLALYHLNPFERRVIHLALAEDVRVTTESQGEDRNRFLVISPK